MAKVTIKFENTMETDGVTNAVTIEQDDVHDVWSLAQVFSDAMIAQGFTYVDHLEVVYTKDSV